LGKARRIAEEFASTNAGTASTLEAAIADLLAGLRDLEGLSRLGLAATRELAGVVKRRGNCRPVLARLDDIDARILAVSSRNIAGFLIQPLIHRIMGAGAGRDAEVLSTSEEMYAGIAESAVFHTEILSRARRLLRD
jgi:hypothetical protein